MVMHEGHRPEASAPADAAASLRRRCAAALMLLGLAGPLAAPPAVAAEPATAVAGNPAAAVHDARARAALVEAQADGDARRAQAGVLHALRAAALATPSPALQAALLQRGLAAQAFALRWRSPSGWQGGPVTALAVSPDGRWRVLAAGAGGLRIADAASGAELATLHHAELGEPATAAISPDGRWLAAGGSHGRVALWALASGPATPAVVSGASAAQPGPAWPPRLMRVWRAHDERVRALAFGPGGQLASGAGDARVRLWDAASGALRQTLDDAGGRVNAVAWAGHGRWLAAAADGAGVRLWPVAAAGADVKAALTLAADGRSGYAVAFDRSGTLLATGSEDGAVRLWDLAAPRDPAGLPPRLSLTGGHFARIVSVAFGGDTWLATGTDDGAVRLFPLRRDVARLPLAADLGRDGGRTLALAFDPAARRLLAGTLEGGLREWVLDGGGAPRAAEPSPGHTMRVSGVALAPDGTQAASASLDGSVRLWDLTTGTERARIVHGTAGASAVAFDAAGRRLLTGGSDGSVRLWSLAGAQPAPLRVLRAPPPPELPPGAPAPAAADAAPTEPSLGGVRVLAFTADGRALAGFSGGALRLWEAADGREAVALEQRGRLVVWALGGGARWVAAATDAGDLALWDVPRGLEAWRGRAPGGPGARPVALAVADDGQRLAVAGDDGVVRVLEVGSGQLIARLGEPGVRVAALAFADGGGSVLLGSADGGVRVFDVASARERARWGDAGGRVLAIARAGDGRTLLTGAEDGRVRWWETPPAASATAIAPVTLHDDAVFAVALDAAGRWMASGSADRSVRLQSLGAEARSGLAGAGTRMTDEGLVAAVALSPDGALLAAGTADGRVRLWATASGAELEALDPGSGMAGLARLRGGPVWALRWSPDGRMLASATEDGSLWLWQPASAPGQRSRLLHRLQGATGRVLALAFDPTGRVLASGGDDGGVRLWDVGTATPRAQWPASAMRLTGLAFDASGQQLATAGFDGRLRVWDVARQTLVAQADDAGGRLWSLALDAGARWLAAGADDGALRLWRWPLPEAAGTGVSDGPAPLRVPLGGGRVQALAISADGRTLAAGLASGAVRTLDLRLLRLLEPATAAATRHALEAAWQLGFDEGGEVVPALRPSAAAVTERGLPPPAPREDGLDTLLRMPR